MRGLRWLAQCAGRVMSLLLNAAIRVYQLLVSPLLGPRCRFYPSCSAYALQAIQTHGPLRGSWLALGRLGRCHPWNPGGVDLVPARERPPTQAPGTGEAGRTTAACADGPRRLSRSCKERLR